MYNNKDQRNNKFLQSDFRDKLQELKTSNPETFPETFTGGEKQEEKKFKGRLKLSREASSALREQSGLEDLGTTTDTGNLKKPWKERKDEKKFVISLLCQHFPNLFDVKNPKPLKINIMNEVCEALPHKLVGDTSVSKTRIRSAIKYYTSSKNYLKAVLSMDERFDLEGVACGVVEESHREHAKKSLDELLLKQKEAKVKNNKKKFAKGFNKKKGGFFKKNDDAKPDQMEV